MATSPTIHAVKSLLDEINYLIYKAKKEIGTQLDENLYVQFFFKHVYPVKAWEMYRELFGSEEIALIRKKYAEETKCVEAGKGVDAGQLLAKTKKDVESKYKDTKALIKGGSKAPETPPAVPVEPEQPTSPESTKPLELPVDPEYKFAPSLNEASYCGVPLRNVTFDYPSF